MSRPIGFPRSIAIDRFPQFAAQKYADVSDEASSAARDVAVSSRILHLDHVCAQFRQEHPGSRAGQNTGQFEYAQIVQGCLI